MIEGNDNDNNNDNDNDNDLLTDPLVGSSLLNYINYKIQIIHICTAVVDESEE